VIDLSKLRKGPTGRQNDKGFDFNNLEVLDVIAVPLVRDKSNGKRYLADPEAIREGQLELHPWLIALAQMGTITDKKTATDLTLGEVRKRLAGRIAQLQTLLVDASPQLIERVVMALAGLVKL